MSINTKDLTSFIASLVIAGVLVFGLNFDPVGFIVPERGSSESKPATTTATVTRVVDGDTIDVQIGTSSDTVRLIGIDAPEIQWPSEENNLDKPKEEDCFAFTAQEWLQSEVKDQRVKLVGDTTQPTRDTYDRRLAYVYLNDQLINDSLLQQGYAKQIVVGDGYDKQVSFFQAEDNAQENNRGLWGECE